MPLRSSTHSSDVLRCDYAHPDTSHLETVNVAFAKRVCGQFFWVQVPVLAVSGGIPDPFAWKCRPENQTLNFISN
jgi:hypothetical protein